MAFIVCVLEYKNIKTKREKKKMKKIIAMLLAASLAMVTMTACQNTENGEDESDQENTGDNIENQEDDSDVFEPIVHENLYTQEFSITEMEDGIQIVIDGEGRELVLVPKELEEVPAEYADSIVIRTPVENAVFLSSTQACALRVVEDDGIFDLVAAVSGDASSWGDIPGIQSRVEDGTIINVAGETGAPNYELIAAAEADVVFVYTGAYPQTDVIEKLDALGITYAVDNEYMESDYLARMEWEKFILAFFEETEAGTQAMLDAVEIVESIAATVEGEEQPKVIFVSEYSGTISVANPTSWIGNMIVDAGGDYMFGDLELDGLSLSMEDFIAEAQTADIIVYTSTPTWMPNQTTLFNAMPLLADVPAVENGMLYQYTDTFWMGIDETDIMIEDLAAVFYPELYEDRELKYFMEIPVE